jgi:uncharacterized protein (DUF433 family)
MMRELDRITFDPDKMNGQACIRGIRLPVATIIRCRASGMSVQQIIADYPDVEAEDITQCLRYAAILVEDRLIPVA